MVLKKRRLLNTQSQLVKPLTVGSFVGSSVGWGFEHLNPLTHTLGLHRLHFYLMIGSADKGEARGWRFCVLVRSRCTLNHVYTG